MFIQFVSLCTDITETCEDPQRAGKGHTRSKLTNCSSPRRFKPTKLRSARRQKTSLTRKMLPSVNPVVTSPVLKNLLSKHTSAHQCRLAFNEITVPTSCSRSLLVGGWELREHASAPPAQRVRHRAALEHQGAVFVHLTLGRRTPLSRSEHHNPRTRARLV